MRRSLLCVALGVIALVGCSGGGEEPGGGILIDTGIVSDGSPDSVATDSSPDTGTDFDGGDTGSGDTDGGDTGSGDAGDVGLPEVGKSGLAAVSGGAVMTSANYKLISTTGQAPGGNSVMGSAGYKLRGGVVGATQP
jgi:hypothetical protein